jgi:hypothetical protein
MAAPHARAISSFDAASRQKLTNGGTVVGGNGGTYRFNPLTGMAEVIRWADGTVPSTAPAAPVAAPAAPVAPRGVPGPATVVDHPKRVVPEGRTPPPGSVGSDPAPTPVATPPAAPAGPTPEETAAEAERINREREETAKREAEDRRRRDAYARLQTVLNEYGLGSLAATVQAWLIEGLSEDEIVQRMRETPEFKTRFPAIEERRKKGLAPISPGEYVAYERQARQMMRAAGIPEGFYDQQEDFTTFLVNDMSLAEMGDRITLAADAAFKMPAEDREALSRWGLGPGDMTAYWLDPTKAQPMLERKQAAAKLSGAAQRSRFGGLDEGTATGLAQLGVTASQAEQGFGQLYDARELFGALDAGEDAIGQGEQIDAAFRGNAQAQRRIEQRKRRRQGVFEGGGGFASGQGGITGLGDSEN